MSTRLDILVALESAVEFDQIGPLVSRSDVEISRVYSGSQALNLATGSAYDLLVLQHPMPDLEFAELFRRIRAPESASCRAPMLILNLESQLDSLREYLDGDLARATALDAAPEQILMLLSELIGIALRAKARVAVELSARLENESLQLFCKTVNISEGGMLIRSRRTLPIGTRVRLTLTLPGDREPIEVEGEVLRRTVREVDPIQGQAVRFLELEADDRARLARFVGEHENALLQRAD